MVYSHALEVQGAVCELALEVQGTLRQLVLDAWLCVAGCSWPWRKGPAILRDLIASEDSLAGCLWP